MTNSSEKTSSQPTHHSAGGHTRSRNGSRFVLICLAIVAAGGAYLWYPSAFESSPSNLPSSLRTGSAAGFNVLMVTLDTTRADRLGCYGYESAKTPTLDRLAMLGIRFADAVSHAPLTLPSHASMFTGLVPPNHGVRDNEHYRLSDAQVTLAEVLRDEGYQTAAFVSAFVLDARVGLDQGFDHYDDAVDPVAGSGFGRYVQRTGDEVTSSAIDWLNARSSDKPFFAWVHYFDPHEAYAPPEPFATQFLDQPYDGEIAYMDKQVGRLIDAVKTQGLWDRTVILVVADHGESLDEHGEPTHSFFLYESTQHVPMILSCPGVFRGPYVVDDVVVAVSDVFPTVIDLLGINPRGPCDGISLLSAYNHRDRAVYMEAMVPYLMHGWSPLYALRRHDDKFILAPKPEYYDLTIDPHETNNLHARSAREVRLAVSELEAALQDKLTRWPSAVEVASAGMAADPETIRRLRALGYVAGGATADDAGTLDPKDMIDNWRLLRRAQYLTETGKLEEALALTLEAKEASPHDRGVLQWLGEVYALMGRYAEAEASFRSFTNIKPSAHVYIMLSQMIMAQGRLDEAWGVVEKAAQLEPKHGGVHIVRGDLLAMQGRLSQAIDSYREALRVDPHRAQAMAEARIRRAESRMTSQP